MADAQETPATTRGLFEGFQAYQTPTAADYKHLLSNGLVVVDTNFLLNLYRCSVSTQEDLFAVMRSIGTNLWIPHHVLSEFWSSRDSTITEARRSEQDFISVIDECTNAMHGAYSQWAKRIALSENERKTFTAQINKAFADMKATVADTANASRARHSRDTNADLTLKMLAPLLHGNIGEPLTSDEYKVALQESKRRADDGIPPGYEDGKKKRNGEGDYLVWLQLMREAKRRNSDVLFVTGDVKEDWWRRVDGQTIGPRAELVAEFEKEVGKRLYMLRPESLLFHARSALSVNVRDESLRDIKRIDEEQEGSPAKYPNSAFRISGQSYHSTVVSMLLQLGYNISVCDADSPFDFLAIRQGKEALPTAVKIKRTTKSSTFTLFRAKVIRDFGDEVNAAGVAGGILFLEGNLTSDAKNIASAYPNIVVHELRDIRRQMAVDSFLRTAEKFRMGETDEG